jgi:hypothetical protein
VARLLAALRAVALGNLDLGQARAIANLPAITATRGGYALCIQSILLDFVVVVAGVRSMAPEAYVSGLFMGEKVAWSGQDGNARPARGAMRMAPKLYLLAMREAC